MWFKVDDKLHDHPKVQRLLEGPDETDALAAMGLWALAGSWSGDQLSDGLVSAFVLRRWHSRWRELAALLVGVGLWSVVDVEGREHHAFHDWTDYNDLREKILADREAERMRIALMRDTKLVTFIKKRDQDRCRYCGSQVRWGNQRGPAGATYDHIKPVIKGGKNTSENVVIACRGCNSRKRHLTLKEAGMRLLPPGTMGAPAVEERTPETAAVLSSEGSTHGSGRVGSGPQNVLSSDSEQPGTPTDS
ncbi:hypothetical protein ASD11_01370 [Aeromicrobium sp. Root495]|uniref:HNH endonuclease n=1 Tax=Aeromicrobium sp. Root495 TaxID=1736550 RepID=UPI0006FB4190|nr:HNH endonuclease [Aeromicrobium sp. Root495]KQY58345.1 hypothetical protein ASD11_01370 [Aeromicrobium sp. Root495]